MLFVHKLNFLIRCFFFESCQTKKAFVLSIVCTYLLLLKILQSKKTCPPFWYVCSASWWLLTVRMLVALPAAERHYLYLQVPGSFSHLLPFSKAVVDHWEVHDWWISEIQQQQRRWDYSHQPAGRANAGLLSLDLRLHPWGAPGPGYARWLLA